MKRWLLSGIFAVNVSYVKIRRVESPKSLLPKAWSFDLTLLCGILLTARLFLFYSTVYLATIRWRIRGTLERLEN